MESLEQARLEGRQRLYPSISNPSWLVLRRRRELFQRWLDKVPDRELSILDVGGRIQPYRALLSNRVRRYVAVDPRSTPLVNVVGQAEHLPLPDGVFDVVFCTQVLEYVADPRTVVAEIYRVLRPGGFLLLSAPTMFPRDSDPEYWRFLPSSLRLLLSSFSSAEVAPEGYSITGVLRTINVFLASLSSPMVRYLLRATLIPTLNVAGMVLESVLPSTNDQFTVNFSVLAQK
jgi:SAM-dependent methyltransferase